MCLQVSDLPFRVDWPDFIGCRSETKLLQQDEAKMKIREYSEFARVVNVRIPYPGEDMF